MADLVLRNIIKRLGNKTVIDDLSMEVKSGELVCLLGESGSGKTTTLRMIGGFIPVDGGQILIDGRDVSSLPPERRPTGMVFQNYALWPNMNVFANVAYGLKVRRVPKAQIRERVFDILRLVGLLEHERKFPGQLSGGQQQRVALARSLILQPKVLLLDEPLSNLDAKLRERVREEIRAIQQKSGITTVLVTHDQEEALSISDKVAVLVDGRIEQYAAPKALYQSPASIHVATFIGSMNLLRGTVSDGAVHIEAGVSIACRQASECKLGMVHIAIRPEDVILSLEHGTPCRITRRVQRGHYDEVLVKGEFGELKSFIGADVEEAAIQAGGSAKVAFERVLMYYNGLMVQQEHTVVGPEMP